MGVAVGSGAAVAVGVKVGAAVGARVGAATGDRVKVGLGEGVGVASGREVAVGIGVGVAVGSESGVAVGASVAGGAGSEPQATAIMTSDNTTPAITVADKAILTAARQNEDVDNAPVPVRKMCLHLPGSLSHCAETGAFYTRPHSVLVLLP